MSIINISNAANKRKSVSKYKFGKKGSEAEQAERRTKQKKQLQHLWQPTCNEPIDEPLARKRIYMDHYLHMIPMHSRSIQVTTLYMAQ